jgi:hypothetical protein
LSWEDELQALARGREDEYESRVSQMVLDHPGTLRKQLRHYLAEQADHGKLKKTYDKVPLLNMLQESLQELVCEEVEFQSDSKLSFKIKLEYEQQGWLVKQFKFDLLLAGRSINRVSIHLNPEGGHDPLKVPRCHFHIGNSDAHIPFPIMNPRLMLYLLCEHIESDPEL